MIGQDGGSTFRENIQVGLFGLSLAAFVMFGAVFISWMSGNGKADASIELKVCAKSTCAETQDRVTVRPDTVLALVEVTGCPECTQLVGKEGRELIVKGEMDDISCQLFGGMQCIGRDNRGK